LNEHNDQSSLFLEQAIARLSAAGWTVRLEEDGNPRYFSIVLEHELSSYMSILFDRESEENEKRFNEVLGSREVRMIADRPTIQHGRVIGKLRTAANADSWPEGVLDTVSRILQRGDIFSEPEAQWLTDAGPTWSGETFDLGS
jgi:hypothetical protein